MNLIMVEPQRIQRVPDPKVRQRDQFRLRGGNETLGEAGDDEEEGEDNAEPQRTFGGNSEPVHEGNAGEEAGDNVAEISAFGIENVAGAEGDPKQQHGGNPQGGPEVGPGIHDEGQQQGGGEQGERPAGGAGAETFAAGDVTETGNIDGQREAGINGSAIHATGGGAGGHEVHPEPAGTHEPGRGGHKFVDAIVEQNEAGKNQPEQSGGPAREQQQ